MLQGSYLTVTESCKYCGALETRPLLVTTVGFVVGGGSWLGDTVTGPVCLGRSTGLFLTGWPEALGLVGSAVVGDVLVWLCWGCTTGLDSAVWANRSLDWRRCRRFLLYSLPSSVLTSYDRMSTCSSTRALNHFLSLSPCLEATRAISPDCKGGSSLLVWL